MPRHLMVDLETLGTVPGCALLSIGAVEWDIDGVDTTNAFHELIYTPSCMDVFLTVCGETQRWWARQDSEARVLLNKCKDPTQSRLLKDVLERFAGYVTSFGGDVQVWGNGSDFDNAILAVAYEVCGMKLPWKFYNNRCYRTLKNMHPDIKLVRSGVYHNAVDDAISQANHAVTIMQRQDECVGVWGDLQDEPLGERGGEAVQQAGAHGTEGSERQTNATGNRVPRQNVPTGIRV